MPIPEMSVDEITAALRRSRLFNVIVEGRDDIIAFRIMERQIREKDGGNVYIISAGGRGKLLQIFDQIRREETIISCAFICDQDLWVFSGVPEEYSDPDLIRTDGYSIENDLLRDYPPQSFMDAAEEALFCDELSYFSQWYSLEVSKALNGLDCCLKCFAGQVLDGTRRDLEADLDGDCDAKAVLKQVQSEAEKLLRGKSLMQIALRQLAKKGRAAKHTDKSFIEHAANANGALFSRISQQVREKARSAHGGE